VVCAGVEGRFTLDDAYCAGRIAGLLGAERSDAAEAAVRLAGSFASAEEGLRAAENPRQEALGDDLAWCARESVLAVVPRLAGLEASAAEIVA
jgi:phosphosulfolactate phosphohydrolase-like enzyme